MIKQIRNVAGATVLGATVLFTPAASALAQPQTGLVNVVVFDDNNNVLSNNNVSVDAAVDLAASVCPAVTAQVGVIAQQIGQAGGFSCDTATGGTLQITRQGNTGGNR